MVLSKEMQSRLTADEASSLQDFFFLLFFTPQVSKSVNDYAKDEVENNDDDHEEEQQVVYHSGCKQRLLRMDVFTYLVIRKVTYKVQTTWKTGNNLE